jgi:hypothetical protein
MLQNKQQHSDTLDLVPDSILRVLNDIALYYEVHCRKQDDTTHTVKRPSNLER